MHREWLTLLFGTVHARFCVNRSIVEYAESEGTHRAHRVRLDGPARDAPGIPPCVRERCPSPPPTPQSEGLFGTGAVFTLGLAVAGFSGRFTFKVYSV